MLREEIEDIVIQKIKDGNSRAFRYITEKYQNVVYTLALRICTNEAEAEEAAQDSFLKAYRSIKNFKGEAKFSTWLYRITYNTAISRVRKKKLNQISTDDVKGKELAGENPEQAYELLRRDEQKKYLDYGLAQLPEGDRALITLYYLNENSVKEIVEITGMQEGQIKTRLHRARKKLYDVLDKVLKTEIKSLV